MTEQPPLRAPESGKLARKRGAPDRGAVPQMEHVRITRPDIDRRTALDRSRGRAVLAASAFGLLYLVLALRLADVTVWQPLKPSAAVLAASAAPVPGAIVAPAPGRADIVDRNGDILAVSLPGAELFADPKQVPDPQAAAARLAGVLPGLNEVRTAAALGSGKSFVYLDRKLTPDEEIAVNALGIPGVYFETNEKRHYPEGDLAAHILGGVTVGGNGIAGVEKWFNTRLDTNPKPLRLSIDIGVEGIVHDELAQAIAEFKAPGGCAIVMNAHDGEILAMVSLPDYDANDLGNAPANARFNRCVTGDYEPGSVFKLQTMSMGLDSGLVHYWDSFDTTHPLHVGRFTINDFEPANKWLTMPEILDVSSNIGASRIATILGPQIERAWYHKQGFFTKLPVQLPEAAAPIYPARDGWGLSTTMTVSFGNGIAVTPLHLVTSVVPIVNGGIRYEPTLLPVDPANPPQGVRIMKSSTSQIMRRMMTAVVQVGTGTYAQVPGYVIGGKTGTAQVVGPNGRYLLHTNNASFMAAFPMNDPQYVVYVLVLQPKPDATTHGFTTGGFIAAPTVSRIIARIGPMLGIMPENGTAFASLAQSLTMPVQPEAPPGAVVLGPGDPIPAGANAFAYQLAGMKPPASAATDATGGTPARAPAPTLSASHARLNHRGPTAPVFPSDGAGALRHETSLAPVETLQLADR